MPSNPGSDGLNELQRRFAAEYLVDCNAGAAYARAGYKANGATARINAHKLLAKPAVAEYVQQRRAELFAKIEVSQEEVLRAVANLALSDRRQLFSSDGGLKGIHDMTQEQAHLIQGLEIDELFATVGTGQEKERVLVGHTKKIKMVSTLDSLRTLGGHFGLFAKSVVHKNKNEDDAGKTKATLEDLMDDLDGAGTGLPPPIKNASNNR